MSLEIKQDSHYQGQNWWKWSVWIEGPMEELKQIENVTYVLHPSFANPVRTVTKLASKFKLSSQGWGIFTIRIKVLKKDGSAESYAVDLELSFPNDLIDGPPPIRTGSSLAAIEPPEGPNRTPRLQRRKPRFGSWSTSTKLCAGRCRPEIHER